MFWNKKKEEETDGASVQWNPLESIEQLDALVEESKTQPVLIYKHSTRCSISSMTLSRLERSWTQDGSHIKAYYLDLIRFRQISNAVAEKFGVYHESPQVIVIKDGKAVFDESHMGIQFENLLAHA